jgi:UDP-N-acetylmuramate dehydrogenase
MPTWLLDLGPMRRQGESHFPQAGLSARISLMIRPAVSLSRLFREALDRPLQRGISLRRHSTFRVGGRADFFFAARTSKELTSCLEFVHERSLPYYVIGAGTNMLFDDEGYRGLILKNETGGIRRLDTSGRVEILAGTPLADLVSFALDEGWTGLEFAAGIPGTVGGAVYGNAGAWGFAIGQLVLEAVLLDGRGRELKVRRNYFEFGYRDSILKKRHLTLLKVVLRLRKSDKGRIRMKMEESLAKRKSPCPSSKMAYAGSFFKNPFLPDGTKVAAGRLLEKVGAKKLSKGGAAVYPGHANFLLNRGGATSADIRGLARTIKMRVKKEFGITLEEEVVYLPADFSMS